MHPDDDTLMDYVAGSIPPTSRKSIASHVDSCPRCQGFISQLEENTSPGRKLPEPYEKTAERDPLLGAQLGEYKILERLGQGGMGIVYRGEQPLIGKPVAIKVLLASIAGDDGLVQRMLGEARAVNAVRHPSIVDIFSFGSLPDGRPYLVMELLEGQSLQTLLTETDQHRLDATRAIHILKEAMAGLEAAHRVGVVHRDLKPDNIFLTGTGTGTGAPHAPRVKLLDFGLAKREGPNAAKLTRPGSVMGTPGYMAPEQVRNSESVSAKTDIYAMGVVAWTMLAGREPFGEGSPVEVMHRHLSQRAPPLGPEAPNLPEGLEALVMRMLSKHPDERPTATEVQAALSNLNETKPPKSRRPLWAVTALGLLVTGAVAALLLVPSPPPQQIESAKSLDLPKPPEKLVEAPPVEKPPPEKPPPVEKPKPKLRSTAKQYRCDRIMTVSNVFHVPNSEWNFFALKVEDEPQLLITGTGREELIPLRHLQKAILRCRLTKKLINARRTNDDHPGLWTEQAHHYTGIEAMVGDVELVKPFK